MRVAILQADSVLPQFQERHGNYPVMIEDFLTRAAAVTGLPIEVTTFDVEHFDYPADPGDFDGYLITGSKQSVYDDDAWIRRLSEFVLQLHERTIKLVGICFGHQLIAQALGGKTQSATLGWGVGIASSDVIKSKQFMIPTLDNYSLVVSHRDQVTILPDGAELVATSALCPNSMYCIGNHILSLQGHPEFDLAYSAELMKFREDILGPETYRHGVASLDQPHSRDEIAIWIVRFLYGTEFSTNKS
jgi:GMP synthase-like glutamine amidotransferase